MNAFSQETYRLIQYYLSSSLSEEDAERLLSILEEDVAAQDYLLEQLKTNTMLNDILRGGYVQAQLAQKVSDVIEHRKNPLMYYMHHRPVLFPVTLAAFVAFLALLPFFLRTMVLEWNAERDSSRTPLIQMPAEEENTDRSDDPGHSLAVLEESVDAVWGDNASPGPGKDIFSGKLHIKTGIVRIRFHSGVVLLVNEDTELDLLSEDRIVCVRGRFDAVVPPGAIGFRVDLPETSVIDLGTIFSVSVRDNISEVQTCRGQVALTEPATGEDTLTAGHAIRFFEKTSPRLYRCNASRAEQIMILAEADSSQFEQLYKQGYLDSRRVLVPDCRVISQRGLYPGMVPNTISAFRKALELGVDACELDVMPAMDGTLFVSNPQNAFMVEDEKMKTAFAKLLPEEILRLDAKTRRPSARGERIPTFDEALSFFRNESDCIVVVNVLSHSTVEAVLDAIDRSGIADRVVFVGRSRIITKALKSMRPSICAGFHHTQRIDTVDQILKFMAECRADFMKTGQSNLTPELLEACRKNSYPIWCHSIESEAESVECFKKGVAAVMVGGGGLTALSAEKIIKE